MNTISQFNTLKFRNNSVPKSVQENQSINGVDLPGTKRLNYSPLAIGLINGGCWVGVGMLFDKAYSFLTKQKINTKVALAFEGALGLFMGYQAYKVAKAEAAENQK